MTIVVQSGVLRAAGNTTAGLVSYWPFNETSGTNANDEAGNHDATVDFSGWGAEAGAYEFSSTTGDSGNAQVASVSAFNTGAALTVCCWVKAAPVSGKAIMSKFDSSIDQRGWFLQMVPSGSFNKLRFLVSSDGTSAGNYFTDGTTLTAFDNTWHHIAGRFGSSLVDTFVNGVKEPSPSRTGSASTVAYFSDVPIGFGMLVNANGTTGNAMDGFAKKFRLYNTAKTDADILAIYNLGQ